MLKRDITYEDFDGDSVTESHYFNLTKTELVQLESSYKDGLEAAMQRIIKSNDKHALILEFQNIILLSYGIKSDDGRRFMKSDAIRAEFKDTLAYDALFMELATDDGAAADFIKGILPKGMAPPVETVEVVDVPVKE